MTTALDTDTPPTELAEVADTALADVLEGQTTVIADNRVSTDSAEAWSQAIDEPDEPARRSWKLTLGLAALALLAGFIAFAASGVYENSHPRPSEPAAAPAPKAVAPTAKPPMPPLLNGIYQTKYVYGQASYTNSKSADWPSAAVSTLTAFVTNCSATTCIATSTALNSSGAPISGVPSMSFTFQDGAWVSAPIIYSDGVGSAKAQWILRSAPDGNFRGESTDTILTSVPGATISPGASSTVPIELTPQRNQ
ncbi:hypothetical protein E2F47_22275 [Mycobacterium eburneum]|nr:hypothetical protein [Mycobacterium eburneum]TDH48895.1 hypothetical protein E2F47_22275 [Mycobacterium eburneum]